MSDMKKLEKLTPELEAKLSAQVDKWTKIGLETKPLDKSRTIRAVERFYKFLGREKPIVEFVQNPCKGMLRINELMGNMENPDFVWPCFCGNLEASWLAFYLFFIENGIIEETKETKQMQELAEIAQETHIFWPLKKVAVCVERPTEIHMVDQRLHKDGGMALRYPDGWGLYRSRGVAMPAEG